MAVAHSITSASAVMSVIRHLLARNSPSPQRVTSSYALHALISCMPKHAQPAINQLLLLHPPTWLLGIRFGMKIALCVLSASHPCQGQGFINVMGNFYVRIVANCFHA